MESRADRESDADAEAVPTEQDTGGAPEGEGAPPEDPHEGQMMDRGRAGCLSIFLVLFLASFLLFMVLVVLEVILDAYFR